MTRKVRSTCAAFVLFALATAPIMASAADEACTGVTRKCTKDITYDKTIGGSTYSCYDCKQALCKDGGEGGLSGTATTSVCTEKATTFRPISLDDQSRGGDTLAPKPTMPRRPGSAMDPRSRVGDGHNFDEADAIFGKRTLARDQGQGAQRDLRREGARTTRDHRKQSDRTTTAPALQAPSDLVLRSVSPIGVALAWRDNSTVEFGVEVYRADAAGLRRNPGAWKLIGTFQERNLDNVARTGMRQDEDSGLNPGAQYCYRMRAYGGFERTHVSGFSDVACTHTSAPASSPIALAAQTSGQSGAGAANFTCNAELGLCECEGDKDSIDCKAMRRNCEDVDGLFSTEGTEDQGKLFCVMSKQDPRGTGPGGGKLRPEADAPANSNAPEVHDPRTGAVRDHGTTGSQMPGADETQRKLRPVEN